MYFLKKYDMLDVVGHFAFTLVFAIPLVSLYPLVQGCLSAFIAVLGLGHLVDFLRYVLKQRRKDRGAIGRVRFGALYVGFLRGVPRSGEEGAADTPCKTGVFGGDVTMLRFKNTLTKTCIFLLLLGTATAPQWKDVAFAVFVPRYFALGSPDDYVGLLKRLAHDGHDQAQELLAREYLRGVHVARNATMAVRWFYLADRNGNQRAGAVLEQVLRDDALAWPRCESLAEHRRELSMLGDHESSYRLGEMYYWGNCTPQNYHKAYDYYREAAMNATHVPSMMRLGEMFERGFFLGGPHLPTAFAWYLDAAKRGDPAARCATARVLLKQGKEEDAKEWIEGCVENATRGS